MKPWSLVIGALVLAPSLAQASVESGIDAYVSGNYRQAYQEWLPHAREGDKDALHNMAVLFLEGHAVEQNTPQAISLLEQAAALGSVASQLELAGLYDSGVLVEADPEQAANWYRRAAEAGSPLAHNNLGLMYLRGTGVERDLGLALDHFSQAAEQGVAAAADNRDTVLAGLVTREVKVRGANVRKGSSTRYPVIQWALRGDKVHVLEDVGDWSHVYVDDDGAVGWIASRLLASS